jgi:RimJ/RimL family protein N-acetyltransferase
VFQLEGVDVLLRPLVESDVSLLAAAASERRDTYLFNRVPEGLDGAKAYIARALEPQSRNERIPFAVVYQDRVVGTTSYGDIQTWHWPAGSANQRTQHPDVVEVGYTWLSHSAQRTGCNTEAKRLLLSHAFDFWQVHRVSFRTDERNERSRRAIERLGATFEGIRRADMPSVDNRVRNSAFYSIIREEWPAVQKRLTERRNR